MFYASRVSLAQTHVTRSGREVAAAFIMLETKLFSYLGIVCC